jgi:hypothetical protein
LEGGYDPEGISMAAENVVRAMLGWQASARSSSKEDLCPPQPLPSTVWKADASMGADYLMSLSPELQTDTPQHDYAFNAVRTDQLGVLAVPMRASNEFAQRPEAVLDAVRRRLNTLPAWRDMAQALGVARVFPELDEHAGACELAAEAEKFDGLLEWTGSDFEGLQRCFPAPPAPVGQTQ